MAYLASSVAHGVPSILRRYLFVAIKTAVFDLEHHFISIIWNTFNDF